MQLSNRSLAVLLVCANLTWGGVFIASKIALEHFAIGQILFGRVVFAALCYVLLARKVFPVKNYRKGDWKWLLAMMLCEPCMLFSFETLGLSYTTASQAGMIVACCPLLTAVGALIFYRENIGRRGLIGIAIAISGVALVSLNGAASESAPNPFLGNVFMLLSATAAASYALIFKRLAGRYSFLFLSAIQCFGGVIFFLPGSGILSLLPSDVIPAFVPASALNPLPDAPASAWAAIVYMGLLVSFFSYFIINYAITRLKAAHVLLFSNLIPVFTLLLAFLILGERLLPLQYGGAALVMAGVLFAGVPEDSSTAEAEAAAGPGL